MTKGARKNPNAFVIIRIIKLLFLKNVKNKFKKILQIPDVKFPFRQTLNKVNQAQTYIS